MSADNGIYILVTRGRQEGEKEYRVAHAQWMSVLWFAPDHPRDRPGEGLNTRYAQMLFGNSRVLTDRKIAEGYAQRMHDEHDEHDEHTEIWCGIIVTLDFSHIRFPRVPEDQEIASTT